MAAFEKLGRTIFEPTMQSEQTASVAANSIPSCYFVVPSLFVSRFSLVERLL